MEFPDLGKQCSHNTCNRLDFLPLKCDSCDKVFCRSHFSYARHDCPNAHLKYVQIPICPLCEEPVPTAPGVEPDITVGQHIDKQCKSDSKKIYTNRCNAKGCKRKELIPVTCSECKLNFCLRHRHTADHECKAKANKTNSASNNFVTKNISKKSNENDVRSLAAKAAESRRNNKITSFFSSISNSIPKPQAVVANTEQQNPSSLQFQHGQRNMTDEEALAKAIAQSIRDIEEINENSNRTNTTITTANGQQSLTVGGRDGQQNNSKEKCSVS